MVWPPNTLNRKDRLLKKIIFSWFLLSQKGFYSTCKVLSKESRPQVKNLKNFFSQTRSQRVLVQFWWLLYEKVSILTDLKGCKISFLISVHLTPLRYSECSTCISSQNRTEMHFFQKMLKIESYMSPIKNPILGIENPCLGPLFKRISFFKKFLSQNLDFWILDFYAIFWLASEVAKNDFLPKAVTFLKWF